MRYSPLFLAVLFVSTSVFVGCGISPEPTTTPNNPNLGPLNLPNPSIHPTFIPTLRENYFPSQSTGSSPNVGCIPAEIGPSNCPGGSTTPTPTPGKTPGTDKEYPKQCFYGDSDQTTQPPSGKPLARISSTQVVYKGVPAIHIKLTFSPTFVDNTYGANSSGGYGKTPKPGTLPKLHTFKDLVGSDHAVLDVRDKEGTLILSAALDYISESGTATSGYAALGVDGGDGKLLKGDRDAILGVRTSLEANFNEYGYVLTQDSPATDDNYSPNPTYPKWNFLVEYEIWVKADAFGASSFGDASIESVHASPSRMGTNTIVVKRTPCPPEHSLPIFW